MDIIKIPYFTLLTLSGMEPDDAVSYDWTGRGGRKKEGKWKRSQGEKNGRGG